MSSHQNADNAFKDCGVWNQLHSEREKTCQNLLNQSRPQSIVETSQLNQSWSCDPEVTHREILQARLRQLDDALDRIMSGSYGECSSCGRWIEDNRLAADPSVSLCIDCQQRAEHRVLGMTAVKKINIH